MLSVLWELITCQVVGAVAKVLVPGTDPGRIWITIIIGIARCIVASYIGNNS
jgi:uncharacterized membrane protein YeaQ/YmgE (transglycosylase-associated protein family)